MDNNRLTDLSAARIEGRELIVSRTFQAPPELVFQTWTNAAHLAHWWGPEGFTITTRAIEVKPGGVWSYVMHGPDGTDYINRIQYVEVVRPERITYIHGDDDAPEHFRVAVTMEAGGRTTVLTMRMTFPTVEALDITVKQHGALDGARSTLARLADELARISAVELELIRTFDAPRALVFTVWTKPEHLSAWWGPTGFAIDVLAFDLKPDGVFHYRMRSADGHEMWGKFVFRSISEPDKLVFVNSFSNSAGDIVRAPFDELIPLEIMNSCTFEEADGKTTVTLRARPINASQEELDMFRSMHASMQQGYGGTFDQLDSYLATNR